LVSGSGGGVVRKPNVVRAIFSGFRKEWLGKNSCFPFSVCCTSRCCGSNPRCNGVRSRSGESSALHPWYCGGVLGLIFVLVAGSYGYLFSACHWWPVRCPEGWLRKVSGGEAVSWFAYRFVATKRPGSYYEQSAGKLITMRSSRSLRSLGRSALHACTRMASPLLCDQALHAERRLTGR
jgi:hypothetical protein